MNSELEKNEKQDLNTNEPFSIELKSRPRKSKKSFSPQELSNQKKDIHVFKIEPIMESTVKEDFKNTKDLDKFIGITDLIEAKKIIDEQYKENNSDQNFEKPKTRQSFNQNNRNSRLKKLILRTNAI